MAMDKPAPDNTSLHWRPDSPVQSRLSAGYSRFVGLMRYLLPGVALVMMIVVVIWPDLFKHGENIIALPGPAGPNGDLTMEQPRYIGKDERGRPFVVTAATATQDTGDKQQISLDALQADLTLSDGTWVTISADTGLYNQGRKTLDLTGNINVFSDKGYEFHGQAARIDLTSGVVTSSDPVNGQGPFGLLNANGMKIFNKEQRLVFTDGVRMTLFPGVSNNAGQ
jgi:lipopolysaccharide export system protein LptC